MNSPLEQKSWCDVISTNNDPNDMWATWKSLLMTCIDSHAPLCSKRAGKKKSPRITSQLLRQMHKRDYLTNLDNEFGER